MRRCVTLLLLIIAELVMTLQAHAAVTPPICGNPDFTTSLQALAGKWSFSAQGFTLVNLTSRPFLAAGQFEATVSGSTQSPVGLLAITMTSNNNAGIKLASKRSTALTRSSLTAPEAR